jgi:hypothetical protein
MPITEILKKLRIRKQFNTTIKDNKTIYYFTGSENALWNICDKLENSTLVKNVNREFFTSGFGRVSFELN